MLTFLIVTVWMTTGCCWYFSNGCCSALTQMFVSFLIRFQPDNARLMASWANEHWLLLQRCLTGSFCRAKRKKRVRVSTQEQKHLGWAFLPFQPLTLRLKTITGCTLSLHTVHHHAVKPERDSLITSASPGQIFQEKAHNMLALHGVKSHFVWELPHTHARARSRLECA